MDSGTRLWVLCGAAGAGKDSVADLLEARGWARVTFAAALKDAVAAIFQWDRGALDGRTPETRAWRETVDLWWAAALGVPHLTPRWVLQHLGTDVLRAWKPDIWVQAALRRIEALLAAGRSVVVTDARFSNEIFTLEAGFGAQLVWVQRPEVDGVPTTARNGVDPSTTTSPDPEPLHISEVEWRPWAQRAETWVVANTGTLADLREAVDALLRGPQVFTLEGAESAVPI